MKIHISLSTRYFLIFIKIAYEGLVSINIYRESSSRFFQNKMIIFHKYFKISKNGSSFLLITCSRFLTNIEVSTEVLLIN